MTSWFRESALNWLLFEVQVLHICIAMKTVFLLVALVVPPLVEGWVMPERRVQKRSLTRTNAASFGSSNNFEDQNELNGAARAFNQDG